MNKRKWEEGENFEHHKERRTEEAIKFYFLYSLVY